MTAVLVSSAAGMTAALLALKLVGLENARRDVKELLRWARVAPQFVWDALEWLSDTVELVIHSTPVRTLCSRPHPHIQPNSAERRHPTSACDALHSFKTDTTREHRVV